MGTPAPPEPDYEEGDNCPACYGIGKPFGDIATPEIIRVTFEDILPIDCNCIDDGLPPIPSIPSKIILWLTQDSVIPCWWKYNFPSTDWGWWAQMWYNVPTDLSYLQLGRRVLGVDCDGDPKTYNFPLFYDPSQPICSTFFDNNIYVNICAADRGGHGGTGQLYWPWMP